MIATPPLCLLNPFLPGVPGLFGGDPPIFISRRAEGPGREILQHPPPPRPSICPFSFCTVTQKNIDVFSRNFYRYVHHFMGVCCIVFDIDGMLFEIFLILKKIKF